MKLADATHMVGIPMCTDKCRKFAALAYFLLDIGNDTILVVVSNVAVNYEFAAICTLDERHIALANINEM